MWPFKQRHKHDWEVIDKRVVKENYVYVRTKADISVEAIGTLEKCRTCGEERARIRPVENDFCGPGVASFAPPPPGMGDVDPFYYRHKYLGGEK